MSEGRPSAETLLRDLGSAPRLTVYLAGAPGAGKTRRLLEDGHRLMDEGLRVAIGWIETKGRPDLDELARGIPRISPRRVELGGSTFEEFDFEAALASRPQVLLLDELAHANLPGGRHAKRWQDAVALRDAGISVAGALNVMHLETVAPIAERLIGFPVREIVPISFLKATDQVIAIDVPAEELISRLLEGRIVRTEDIDRSRSGLFRPQTLAVLRELLLRTIDDLTVPQLEPEKTSTALALVTADIDVPAFLARVHAVADALDLQLAVMPLGRIDPESVERAGALTNTRVLPPPADGARFDPRSAAAAMIVIPSGPMAAKLAAASTERDILILDAARLGGDPDVRIGGGLYGHFAGDRRRMGYGRLAIYLGSAAGSGKTYAMLDRAHRLKEEGVDVVAAFVETHRRAATEKMLEGLELLPRLQIHADGMTYGELDLDATLARQPKIALVDELAHSNAPGSFHEKRYDDVMTLLRAGINVITTLNVQHLEGLNDAVFRLTGTRVRETVPDAILSEADDVVFIDVTPDVLRERLRQGKVYPPERVEAALANFFKTENLAALRELAVREVVRARGASRKSPHLRRLALGVKARERDIALIERAARLASRLDIDLSVIHVARAGDPPARVVESLEQTARRVRAQWSAVSGKDGARTLLEAAAAIGATTIAVEGSHTDPHWPRRATFAKRLIDGGARQLLVLARVD